MSENAGRQVRWVLETPYQFLAWLVPTIERFPRRQKFMPGDRLESTALDLLEGAPGGHGSRDAPAPAQRMFSRLLDPVAAVSAGATVMIRVRLRRGTGRG